MSKNKKFKQKRRKAKHNKKKSNKYTKKNKKGITITSSECIKPVKKSLRIVERILNKPIQTEESKIKNLLDDNIKETKSNFIGLKKYNSIAANLKSGNEKYPPDYLKRNGDLVQSVNGSYGADIIFMAKKSGFVVQKIEKQVIELNNSKELKDDLNVNYWEIFYIVPHSIEPLESYNADGFVQTELGENSSGKIIQVGTSWFYPLPDDHKLDIKFDDGKMIETDQLKGIFGNKIKFDKDGFKNANGLPSCIAGKLGDYTENKPKMTDLIADPRVFRHKIEVTWKGKDKDGNNFSSVSEHLTYQEDGEEHKKYLMRPDDDFYEKLPENEKKTLLKLLGHKYKNSEEATDILLESVTKNFGC